MWKPVFLSVSGIAMRVVLIHCFGGLTIPGVMVVWAALAVMWLNERRSAKTNTLLVRGSTECVSITADMRDDENRGQLVHVTGVVRGRFVLNCANQKLLVQHTQHTVRHIRNATWFAKMSDTVCCN